MCIYVYIIYMCIYVYIYMWCIRAYEYTVSEAKMTKIFAIYLQTSDFPSQSSEYIVECIF